MFRPNGCFRAVCSDVHFYRACLRHYSSRLPRITVSVPNAIKRTHTELLETLSQTVTIDETAPHFSLIDDPALIPTESGRLKDFCLSKEMGRRAARILAAEWPTLFQYDHDEPRLDVFRPLAELDPRTADPSEPNLVRLLDERKVCDAIKLYERISLEGVEVSQDVLKRLFFLTCYYNGANAPVSELEEWHNARNFNTGQIEQVPFEQGGTADLLFETLEKSEDVYSAMIAGLCKFPNEETVKRARTLYEEMKRKKITPHIEAFCGLIKNADSFEDACLLCKEMSACGVRPNIHVFNNLLEVILKDKVIDRNEETSKVLREARKCSCHFSLTTYRNVLRICQLDSDKKLHVTRLIQVLDELEKCDTIRTLYPKEQVFFTEAMQIAYEARNLMVADRIMSLYNSPKNQAKLPELTDEATFYAHYLKVSIPVLPIEDLEKRYKSLVPRAVGLSRAIAQDMLDRLQKDSKWSLVRRVIEDTIAARYFLDNICTRKACEIICFINLKVLTPDERDECRDLANRIADVLDNYSNFSGYSQKKWTPRTLALCSRMLLNVGERKRGWHYFSFILDESLTEGDTATVSPIGFPWRNDIIAMMDDALSYGDWENACNCLEVITKYGTELKMQTSYYAEKILKSCKLTPSQKTVLRNYANLRNFS